MTRPAKPSKLALAATVLYALCWIACLVGFTFADNWQFPFDEDDLEIRLGELWSIPVTYTSVTYFVGFTLALPISLLWIRWSRGKRPLAVWSVVSLSYVVWWQWTVYAAQLAEWHDLRATLAQYGLGGLFFIGLGWTVWLVERAAHRYRERRHAAQRAHEAGQAVKPVPAHTLSPLDPEAWYYGRSNPKLTQSLAVLSAYSIAFVLAILLATQFSGCQESIGSPAGGGKQETIAQLVKIQKVIKKKFIINPFSSVIFKVPPIDEVKLQLTEVTQHKYTVGYGEGSGAGYGGTGKADKIRFIRLEYPGGDWDQDFGIGADLNMLVEFNVRTGMKVADQTESRTVAQLKNFTDEGAPRFVYVTGQKNITLSKSEITILRDYLLTKHGMLFGDNGGSPHFHNQFFAMMRQVLPTVEPVKIPLDDVIHRVPYQIPYVPYVAPHGGKDAWGWKVDGRWVCYYHPGDIGDAWTDDHSGVKPEVYEACYQLGVNVINYAYTEHRKWLDSRNKKK
jgi:hypothetical protein